MFIKNHAAIGRKTAFPGVRWTPHPPIEKGLITCLLETMKGDRG